MRLPSIAVLLIAPMLAFAQQSAAPQSNPSLQPIPWGAPSGATVLWNGHDITGWTLYLKGGATPPANYWSVGDAGVLHVVGTPTGYLRTNKDDYGNFHLHAEWRWTGPAAKGTNNSGIFVFQHPPDVVWPNCVQVQVKAGVCGDLISMPGYVFPGQQPNATLKKMAADSEKPVGDWNGYDIYCRGASIEVYVNGVRQNYVDKLPVSSGQIALQFEGYPIEFRNLWIEDAK